MEGQADFHLLSLEIPAPVSEGHPPPLFSLPGREMQVWWEWRGQIWGDTRTLSVVSWLSTPPSQKTEIWFPQA